MSDRIERSVLIKAPLDRVWDLVTEPGWWVPSQAPALTDWTPGAIAVRESEQWGRFPVQVVSYDPKTYAAFRWASTSPGEDLADDNTTLVEFHLATEAEAVKVTVVETGFAALPIPEEVRRKGFDGNTQGWGEQLDSLRDRAQQPA
ncbi:SRPBCC domain-containing protein [Micromonospora sp. RTP1Z1]|uniref:SRPBCC domain-containing protein n=1 Tax=Micromonospora sp. RTP1Z1 TaxID=2994043 RepID=UPI0029C70154|nr:SRPBCC domain-containing protein [Micromonospora sp. RTP1Z1]